MAKSLAQQVWETEMQRKIQQGITTFGETIEGHEETIYDAVSELEEYSRIVRRWLSGHNGKGENILNKRICVAHFNYYCPEKIESPQYLLPAEFAFYSFSLRDGLYADEGIHGIVNPEFVPQGLRCEMTEMAKDLCLPMVGHHEEVPPVTKVWECPDLYAYINGWVEKYGVKVGGVQQCIIFVQRDDIAVADRCLKWLKVKLDEALGEPLDDCHEIVIIPLSVLTMELVTLLNSLEMNWCSKILEIPNEGAAERILEHPLYMYCPELGCNWHAKGENQGKVDRCSKSIVMRMIYNLIHFFTVYIPLEQQIPNHRPLLKQDDIVDRAAMKYLSEERY